MVDVSEAFKPGTDLIGLYFSMHACPPCRIFTPLLSELYKMTNEDEHQFEVVFLSGDKTIDLYNEYYEEMPWLAMPHKDPRFKKLCKHFGARGIPRLLLLSAKDGRIVS